MDRHATLARTEEWWVGNGSPLYARDDANLLFSVTARRLTADVAVQSHEAESIKSD